jgi:hypothetical protein
LLAAVLVQASTHAAGVFAASAPAVTGLSPISASTLGGDEVTLQGSGFTGVTAVNFGSGPAPSFKFYADSLVTAVSPAHAAGTVDVTVTTAAGTSPASAADQFTFRPPAPCTSVTASSSAPYPYGATFQVTGSAATCPGPRYEFWVLPPGYSTWQLAQVYSNSSSIQLQTSGVLSGTYYYSVWAMDSGSTGTSGDALGRWDAYAVTATTLTPFPCRFVTVSAAPPSPSASSMVAITGAAPNDAIPPEAPNNCLGPLFEFWLLAPGSSTWRLVQAYSYSTTFNWDTTRWPSGVYQFSVWGRDVSSRGIHSSTYGRWDAYAVLSYTLKRMPCTSVTASAAPASPSSVSATVTITGSASGCPKPLYEFWILVPGSITYQLVQAYSTSSTFIWDNGDPPGTYHVSVWARDANSIGTGSNTLGRLDASATIQYALTALPFAPCTGTAVGLSPSGGTALSGTTVTMSFTAYGCSNPRYKLWMKAPGSSTWQLLTSYHPGATFNWDTTGLATGAYSFRLFVRDASSPGVYSDAALGRYDAYGNFGFNLTSQACISVSASLASGTTTTTAVASGCPKPQFEFWGLAPGSSAWQLIQAYSSSATAYWQINSAVPGVFRVSVWARDASSIGTAGDSLGRWDTFTVVNGTLP